VSRLLCALVLVCGSAAGLFAQQPAAARDTSAPKPQPLFESNTPLAVTFSADFGALAKERGTKKDTLPGTLTVVGGAGDSVTLKVQVYTRGHYRLKICQYPPLKIVFDRNQVAGTVFANQKGLKLVGQCRSGRAYANYLLEEHLIYRAYNLLTDKSFRTRLALVTYVDANPKHAPETRYAFFLEDDDRMARRNHATVYPSGVNQGEADDDQMALFAVFQYMIGNTDWAVSAQHNVVVLRDSGGTFYPVPYDFDWSGVIWPPYANPDPSLNLINVRQRTFRNSQCYIPQILERLFTQFNAQKDSIYTLYRAQEGLEPKRVKQTLDYYDDFYHTINDAGATRREFINGCARR
jgi:hypothetical protein